MIHTFHRISTARRALILGTAWTLLATGGTALAQEWAGAGRAQGIVVTEADEPIAGAEVKLFWGGNEDSGPAVVKTNKKGRWGTTGLRPGTWQIDVDIDGYVPSRQDITVYGVGAPETNKTWMKPVPPEVREAERLDRANELLAKGNELNLAGDHAAAREAYENVIDELAESERPRVLHAIANTYVLEENNASATEYLNQSLALDPSHVDSLRLMVAILVADGRDSEAEQYIARLPEGAELDPRAQINLGIRAYNEGNYDEAAKIFEQVSAAHPDIPDAIYFSGLVHLNQQKNEQALEELKRFLELAPDHEKAAEAKDFLSYLEGAVSPAATP